MCALVAVGCDLDLDSAFFVRIGIKKAYLTSKELVPVIFSTVSEAFNFSEDRTSFVLPAFMSKTVAGTGTCITIFFSDHLRTDTGTRFVYKFSG